MLNFQTDYDEATGEQVLTCFLLPQMEYQAEQMGKFFREIKYWLWSVLFYFGSQKHVLFLKIQLSGCLANIL